MLEAVEETLKALRRHNETEVLDKIKATKVLAGIVGCRPREVDFAEDEQTAVIADALSGIMLAPGQPQGWLELAQVAGEAGRDEYASEMAVLNTNRQILSKKSGSIPSLGTIIYITT